MSFYNVVFTILPPLVIGVFDQFVSARMLDRYPQLYQLGQQNYFFAPITFFYWVGNALYHSVVCVRSNVAGSSLTGESCSLLSRASSFRPTCSRQMERALGCGFGARRCTSASSSQSSAKPHWCPSKSQRDRLRSYLILIIQCLDQVHPRCYPRVVRIHYGGSASVRPHRAPRERVSRL